jgi:hypothetical protein
MQRRSVLALAALIAACAHGVTYRPRSAEAEARAIMSRLSADLNAGDREAIIRTYDGRGAFFVGGGQKVFRPPTAISAFYRSADWTPPAHFEWHDLSYEVLGPNAVVVSGCFEWAEHPESSVVYSYTGLLVRQASELKLRLEHEDEAPRSQVQCARTGTKH